MSQKHYKQVLYQKWVHWPKRFGEWMPEETKIAISFTASINLSIVYQKCSTESLYRQSIFSVTAAIDRSVW